MGWSPHHSLVVLFLGVVQLAMSMTAVGPSVLEPLGAKRPKVEVNGYKPLTGDLLVKKLSSHATIPTRGSSMAAGYDLYR